MNRAPGDPAVLRYGSEASQTCELWRPAGPGPHPLVVLVHGGFWRVAEDRRTTRPLARQLARRGFAVLNLEYRRLGEPGAGWPGTFLDTVRGVEAACGDGGEGAEVDPGRVAIVGLCAGGHLALWTAAWLGSRIRPRGAPAAGPVVRAVVAVGAVTDLRRTVRQGPDATKADPGSAVVELLGGAEDHVADRYRLGSPLELLPLGCDVAQLLVHGAEDALVPAEQSARYVRSALRLGDDARLVTVPAMGHAEVIGPRHAAWAAVLEHLRTHLGPG